MKSIKELLNKIIDFFKESYEELKRVSWPNRQQTIRLTAYVLGVSLGVAVFVWGVDFVVQKVLTQVLLK